MILSKTLWVSGGSTTGIGRATAIKFITQGWTVVISARDLKKLNSLKKEIEKNQRSKKIFVFKCDIRDKNQVSKTVLNIEKNIGSIDIALLNAGTTHPYSENFNLDYYNHVVKTNISGTLNCINAIYPIFKKREKGHIAVVSSMVGYRGLPTASAYTMSKAALINLAESLFFNF